MLRHLLRQVLKQSFQLQPFSPANTGLGSCDIDLSNQSNANANHHNMRLLSCSNTTQIGVCIDTWWPTNLRPGHLFHALPPQLWQLRQSLFGDLIFFSLSLGYFNIFLFGFQEKKMSSNTTSNRT